MKFSAFILFAGFAAMFALGEVTSEISEETARWSEVNGKRVGVTIILRKNQAPEVTIYEFPEARSAKPQVEGRGFKIYADEVESLVGVNLNKLIDDALRLASKTIPRS
ncbi:unnamed protein product [Ixodes persulcatus]